MYCARNSNCVQHSELVSEHILSVLKGLQSLILIFVTHVPITPLSEKQSESRVSFFCKHAARAKLAHLVLPMAFFVN